MKATKGNTQQGKGISVSLIVFAVLLVLVIGVYTYVKNFMPNQVLGQGKKYIEVGNYSKALNMFELAAKLRPYDSEPIYYQALAISKLPPSYKNQKALYDIAQLEDCEEASQFAESVLMNMRRQIEAQVGSNYIDNILYEDELIRWNASQPITYSINADAGLPQEYISSVKQALQEWQAATNGDITFKETPGNSNANIVINFMDDISLKDSYEETKVGKTIPAIYNGQLQRMDVYLRKYNSHGGNYNEEHMYTVALHEIGHALGLGGHSSDPSDVMYYTGDYIDGSTYRKDITRRDMNTINMLYKLIPDVVDIPISPEQYDKLFYHEILTTYPGENFERETKRLLAQLEQDRKNVIVWVDLAINYAFKKQYERSNYVLFNVLPLVGTDVENQHVILYNLAVNYYKLGDYSKSSSYLVMAQDLKSDVDTQILETFIDVKLGRLDLAQKKLRLLIQQYPENIEIAVKLAEVYGKLNDKAKEKQVINDLIKRNPKAARDRRVLKYNAKK